MVTGKMAKAKEKRKAKAKTKASEIQLLDALAMARSSCDPISTSDGGRLLIEETAFLLVRFIMSPRVASPKDAINPRGDGDPQRLWWTRSCASVLCACSLENVLSTNAVSSIACASH